MKETIKNAPNKSLKNIFSCKNMKDNIYSIKIYTTFKYCIKITLLNGQYCKDLF